MELTREQAITEHRKMWRWIAEQYIGKDDIYYMNPYRFKQIYLYKNGYNSSLIHSCCFLCEYVKKWKNCDKCPLDWGISKSCIGDSKNDGLYKQINTYYYEENYKKCAELARQIAELPEKQ